ncbi:MAG: GWxTD domain-containing protein [bacterium]
MLKRLQNSAVVILLFPCILPLHGQAPEVSKRDYYQEGVAFREEGDCQKALNVWLQGARLLKQLHQSDPRLGIAFIELVTEREVFRFYDLACELYFWGFTQYNLHEHKKDVEREVERIAPLLTDKDHKEWQSMVKKEDVAINEKIRAFWKSKDPTPSTKMNERLLEHWQRIAHSRKNYTLASTTPYGTDDRGLIYVKYGKPDRITKGSLGTRRASFKTWTNVMLNNERNTVLDANGSDITSVGRAERQNLLLNEVDRYNNFPEYELWYYRSFQTPEPIVYLFGNRNGNGLFGLRNGVEEFIPSGAFLRTSSFRMGGISAGALLQSVYYSELMHLHPQFEDRYLELERIWGGMESGLQSTLRVNNAFRLKRMDFKTTDDLRQATASAPLDKSNFEKTTSEVKLLVTPFRFLNDRNNPSVALIATAFPAVKMDFIKLGADKRFPDYSVNHTVIAYDRNGREAQRLSEPLLSGEDNLSTFILPHAETLEKLTLITEVFEASDGNGLSSANGVTSTPLIIGVGRKDLESPPPLSPAAEVLELSDLLLGVDGPTDQTARHTPFSVVPSTRILATDALKIYLEIYHLYFDGDGQTHYSIDFSVVRLKGEKREKNESISLSFNFDGTQRRAVEEFVIDISKLVPAYYELIALVTDEVSAQKKQRTQQFEIIAAQ